MSDLQIYPTTAPANLADEETLRLVAYLQQQAAEALNIAPAYVDPQRALSALGLDSLHVVELQHRIEIDLGVIISMAEILQGASLVQLAERVRTAPRAQLAAAPAALALAAAEEMSFPLSHGQRALWFLHHLAPESAVYTIASAVRIRGALDLEALRRAFQILVERHPALRSAFVTQQGEPMQQVHPHGSLAFTVEDASGWSADALDDRLARAARHPFDLARGPLLRVYLFHRSADEHLLLLTVHHLVADLSSLAILIHELAALYPAEKIGATAQLAPPNPHYRNYVRWEAAMLAGPESDRLWGYWRDRLAGAPPVLNLPTDRPHPPIQTYRGATHPFVLSASLTQRIRALAQRAEATPYIALLAAFQALLSRYSGQSDILTGSPVAGRTRADWADSVGYFVNTVVMRSNLAGNPTFADFLAQARRTVLEAFAHQDYPFAMLVERLQPVRDPSRAPLVQAAFALQSAHLLRDAGLAAFALGETGAHMPLGDLQLESVALAERAAPFELTLILAETEGALLGVWQYNADLFSAATIARMAAHWLALASGMVADPSQRVGSLSLLTRAEQRQLLAEWNDTRTGYPAQTCIHALVQAQAARAPDAVALTIDAPDGERHDTGAAGRVAPARHLTYAALNQRANRTARHLQTLGVQRDVCVALCLDRSFDLIIAMLAVLKAGGVYVPLDPAWPIGRMRWIASAIQTRAIITHSAHLRTIHDMRWALPCLTDVLCLDIQTPLPPPEPLEREAVRALWDHVAERAVDRVTAGGFISSYTGRPFRAAEVDAYRDHVLNLARPYLGPQQRVLEIGCGSGLIMFALAPQVGRYFGLDPSAVVQAHNQRYIDAHHQTNITLLTGFADDLGALEPKSVDLVILASTVQFFPGPFYLRRVLEAALAALAPGGAILLADIPDARQKETFRASLETFRRDHRSDPHVQTKTHLDTELYLDEDLFADLQAELDQIASVRVYHREAEFVNELRYRYDVIITKLAEDVGAAPARKRAKPRSGFWTAWHLCAHPDRDLPSSAGADDVAYIIYTSGSTGAPKGVVVRHAAVVNLIDWVNRAYQVGADDRLLFVTSVCFDLSVYDVFGVLAAGGAIQIATEADLREPAQLVRTMYESPITFWDSAPAALQQLAPFFSPERSTPGKGRLRLAFLSGDWIPVPLPDLVRAAFPGAAVISLGGATEATVWSNYYQIGAVDPQWASIPYGRPIQNAQYYILDAYRNPCPIGVPGDLYIGGECLASGYAANPAQTAAQFVPHPFSARPGARLYATGDRARYWPDGLIEFLGRRDLQVKLRGFRIELEEIETVLSQSPAVRAIAVVARRDSFGDARLVAYVVPSDAFGGTSSAASFHAADSTNEAGRTPLDEGSASDEAPLSSLAVRPASLTAELREWLGARLPDYMTPAAFVLLDALPLTSNGKVDRAALPEPDWTDVERETAFVAPNTEVETVLADLWATVLRLDLVGIYDNFFALGGHSLLATQMIARLRDAFDVELPLRALFEGPTVAELARRVEAVRRTAQGPQVPAIHPRPRDAALPLSFAQQRIWFLDQLVPGSSVYAIPAAIRLIGPLDYGALRRSFDQIVRRHEVLRTTFATMGEHPLQVIRSGNAAFLAVADLRLASQAKQEDAARRLVTEAARRPFDLSRGPLLRITLARLGEQDHILLLTVHHIVFDGWSTQIFIREFATLYEAYANNGSVRLPDLPIQYADYAYWQRQWLQGALLDSQLAYWRRRLSAADGRSGPPLLDLPTDRPRPPIQTFEGAQRALALSQPLSDALRTLSRREGVTMFMLLLAAFQGLLARYTGQKDILVGSPIAGRTRRETEDLIGCFVNTLVLRVDLSGAPTFRQALARVQEVCLGAYAHQDLPFERLVEDLHLERDLSRTPLFQALFALQHDALPTVAIAGLAVHPLAVHSGTAKFDLTFDLTARPDRIDGYIEYNTDLFDAATIARIARHFEILLEGIVADPEQRIADLPLLTGVERQQLLVEWNDTRASYSSNRCVHQLFERQAGQTPDACALVFDQRADQSAMGAPSHAPAAHHLTYAALNRRANQLAWRLHALGVRRSDRVAICLDRSFDLIIAMLAALKVGGAYVPLEPAWPRARLHFILSSIQARAIITHSASLRSLHELRWALPKFADLICLDIHTPLPPPEPLEREAVRALWDHVAQRATDRVSAGGFISSYTGRPFRAAEVDAYRDHVINLARPYLGPQQRVLEIGCGSGLIMFALAPQVGRYFGLDPSAVVQAHNQRYIDAHHQTNITLLTGFADDLGALEPKSVDLVILASTVQFFPGPFYLRRVLEAALNVLRPGGTLLLADIPDARQKEAFRASLEAFRRAHRSDPDVQTKTSLDSELYLDEDLFAEFAADMGQIAGVSVAHRGAEFANELRYRYDVRIEKAGANADRARASRPAQRRSRIWTAWHLRERPARDLPALAGPEDVAYIIHTSGSTGAPKGVAARHSAVVNLLEWVNRTYQVGERDRLLFVTSVCFDLSVYDVFGTLAAGGTLHIAGEADLRDPVRLVRLLYEMQITFWNSAPAALQQLAPFFAPGPSKPRGRLRLAFLSGDWIPLTLPDQTRAAFPGATVVNLGGATESTVWSNYYQIGAVDPQWASIPYGRPLQNVEYYILDERGAPCPIGVLGDLYIAGTCLTIGYAAQARQTAAQFVPHPFGLKVGERMYATGDRACYRPDGVIEFLGRRDQQVKIRGFRIELGEIAAALRSHPAVREQVVLVREDRPGDRRLVVYIVPTHAALGSDVSAAVDPAVLAGELRDHLRQTLPGYMIPAAFVFLEALPLTSNGKVDRAGLPAPDGERPGAAAYVAPRTPLEELIARTWADVLGRERVGVHDNFFALGGHSLLATQAIARLRAVFQVDLPLRRLFDAPTAAEFAEQIAAARAERQTLPPLHSAQRPAALPLSFAQQRLWFLDQLTPNSAAYNIPAAVHMAGRLDIAALRRSIATIVGRHESLRTTFALHEGQPTQVIAPATAVPLPVADLRGLPAPAREAEIERRMIAAAQRPFDLARGPLLRVVLLRLAEREHILLLTMHHIISDGWSIGVLVREISVAYSAFVQNQPAPLPPLPIQYADYAIWQRQWLQSAAQERELNYWRRQLAGAPALLDLSIRNPRVAGRNSAAATLEFRIAPALSDTLAALNQRENVTPFMTLLAAFQVLLMRYAEQTDIVVGTPIAGRTQPETEALIGYFVNTLVLRADLADNPSFQELLRRVRAGTLDAYAHQDVPFERLVEVLQPERHLSSTPLFQVLFVLQNAPMPALELPDLTIHPLSIDNGAAKFELILSIEETAPAVRGTFQYDTGLFDAGSIARMARHFETLLGGIGAAPALPIGELPLLTDDERNQIMAAGDATGIAYPDNLCLHTLFERQAALHPEFEAVSFEGATLSYGELNAWSNRIAHGLRALGARPAQPIALMMNSGVLPIATLFGILKAGGVFVCLDPTYPAARLKQMLDALRPPLAICEPAALERHRALLEQAAHEWTCRTIVLAPDRSARADGSAAGEGDADAQYFADQPTTNPHPLVGPSDPAYIAYTSGSTGAPKGIVHRHENLAQFVQWQSKQFGVRAPQCVAQLAALTFDVAYCEIFGALCFGAALCVVPPSIRHDPLALARWMKAERITLLQVIASLFRQVLHAIDAEQADNADSSLAHLECALFVGEPLPADFAASLLKRFGSKLKIFNIYGPTEAVAATFYPVEAIRPDQHTVPIGYPIDGRQILIISQAGQLCPIGVKGEIVIRSPYLSLGYLGRDEETRRAFIQNPLQPDHPDRVYRTGDLGRWLPDGILEFGGRADNQVKIRGIRIELEDVEAAVIRHPSVRECAVVALRHGDADQRLAAYVVPNSELLGPRGASDASLADELRAFLKENAPPHMHPSSFTVLGALPRTPNGKIDRKALPEPDTRRMDGRSGYVAPRTPLEKQLADIVGSLLQVDTVGVHDNFFDLGGHSLLATQVINKVREACSVDLPLQRFFEDPTVDELARMVQNARAAQDSRQRITRISQRVEQLSDEEVRALLAQKRAAARTKDVS